MSIDPQPLPSPSPFEPTGPTWCEVSEGALTRAARMLGMRAFLEARRSLLCYTWRAEDQYDDEVLFLGVSVTVGDLGTFQCSDAELEWARQCFGMPTCSSEVDVDGVTGPLRHLMVRVAELDVDDG